MRRTVVSLLLAGLLGGCHAHYGVQTGAVSPGGEGLYARIGIGGTAADVIAGGALLGVFLAGQQVSGGVAPVMKPDRRVNEQDCRQPVVDTTANLRCI
ncbi:MAG: hypothetical protein IRY96_09235 [Burkholderiales bacterium]|nr:hypothetical protein [Burkholderiales bacterium]